MSGRAPLTGLYVVDLSSGVAGGYCTKTLADGGAEVVKLEAPGGDPLRRFALGGEVVPGEDGPLFEFLGCSKQSVVLDPDVPADLDRAEALVAAADVVVWSKGSALAGHPRLAPDALRHLAPGAVVATITPFGLEGPWADRPASDLTLQASAGGVFSRGAPDRAPVQIGGRLVEWLGGMFCAVGALTAWRRARECGTGELVDVSLLECLVVTEQMYGTIKQTMTPPSGVRPPERQPTRSVLIPAIYATKDGWVGFMVATATMWESFCIMVEHPEWLEDGRLYAYAGRLERYDELEGATAEWCGRRTTDEVLEQADLLRVPAAPVGDGASVTGLDQFVERRFFVRNPRSGRLQPDTPYTLGAGAARRPTGPPPRLGEHNDTVDPGARPPRPAPPAPGPTGPLPFAGLRVADFTAFWAGPIVGHFLSMLGAEVIHVESVKRPDGIRGHTILTTEDDRWWEWTPNFHGSNTNKRDLTLDMSTEEGRALARRLIERCDVVLENYAPRVMDQWGLDGPTVLGLRPDVVFVRMPAFGLSGPWRERTGYAQNMEQVSGMAWMTGHADDRPLVPNGMCDPVAGTHALFALLLALEHRRATGEGMLVEVSMVGGALNVTAEQALEYQAFGHLMTRDGNRGPTAAPQNLYRCSDAEDDGRLDMWVAVAVETDEQWAGLRRALGDPAWAAAPELGSAAGRRAAHDEIDGHLASWCEGRPADEVVEVLAAAGVPVGRVLAPAEVQHLEQLAARGFLETVVHPLTGQAVHTGYPVRFSAGPRRLHHRPAPTLGQDNRELLTELLGVSPEAYARLEAADVIGTRLLGEHRAR
ncbi:MAG TPA: CoA transferase [Acidimicrobiales bacterium]|nr:CoA transferase [Acidimicrobiales bacterium]